MAVCETENQRCQKYSVQRLILNGNMHILVLHSQNPVIKNRELSRVVKLCGQMYHHGTYALLQGVNTSCKHCFRRSRDPLREGGIADGNI